MPKEEVSPQKASFNRQVAEATELFKRLDPQPNTPEEVLAAAKQVFGKVHNPTAVVSAVKGIYQVGLQGKDLKATADAGTAGTVGQVAKSAKTAVKEEVEKVIAAEATAEVRRALDTGKGAEDVFGPYARHYGYENTNAFVGAMFDFWETWHGNVQVIARERAEYKWALREVLKAFTPEAKKALKNQMLNDTALSVMLMGQQTGKFPPPETMRGYLQILKEELIA